MFDLYPVSNAREKPATLQECCSLGCTAGSKEGPSAARGEDLAGWHGS